MGKKVKEQKAPRTIKVKTLVKHIIIAGSIVLAFIAGGVTTNIARDRYNEDVKKQSVIYLTDVKEVIKAVVAEPLKQ